MQNAIQSIVPLLVLSQFAGSGRNRRQISGGQIASGLGAAVSAIGAIAAPVTAWAVAPKEVTVSPTAQEFNDLRRALLVGGAIQSAGSALGGIAGSVGAFLR